MRIEKKSYSSKSWRLVTDDGRQVSYPQWINHPDLGETLCSAPVCGQTKRECVESVLSFVEWLIEHRSNPTKNIGTIPEIATEAPE